MSKGQQTTISRLHCAQIGIDPITSRLPFVNSCQENSQCNRIQNNLRAGVVTNIICQLYFAGKRTNISLIVLLPLFSRFPKTKSDQMQVSV